MQPVRLANHDLATKSSPTAHAQLVTRNTHVPAQLALPHGTRNPFAKTLPGHKHTRVFLLAYAHSPCRCPHHSTPTPAFVENTRLCYEHSPLCYPLSTPLLLHTLKPVANAHTALLPHATPSLKAPFREKLIFAGSAGNKATAKAGT